MGQQGSVPVPGMAPLVNEESLQPVQYTRMGTGSGSSMLSEDYFGDTSQLPSASHLLVTAFAGVWSSFVPTSLGPASRVGHYTVVDEANQIVYIGNGTTQNGQTPFDLWSLDLRTYEWRQVPLSGVGLRGRNGSRAILIAHHIFVFGGYVDKEYLAEAHIIDVTTGIVSLLETSGKEPPGRSTPILGFYNNKVYLWGGYNGQWLTSIHILDLNNLEWTEIPTDEKGRTGVPFIQFQNCILSYGGSHVDGVFSLNMEKNKIEYFQTTGFAPPKDVMSSCMLQVERYIFFFGGKVKTKNEWTFLYALDLEKKCWFIFHVKPDGETVNMADGFVTPQGLFMLPRIHSLSAAYSKNRREIVAFLGHPHHDPPFLLTISVGEAFGYIHIREDMLHVLYNYTFESQHK